jgi:hypothetical protein
MFKPKLYMVFTIFSLLVLVSGACAESSTHTMTATPLEVPKEGSPGEYIDVIIQVSSDQPCKLVLSTPHKTEVDNYLSPNTSDTLTIPNSDGTVVFHERIPWETVPGSYVLRVIQMRRDGDTEGKEIFSQHFKVN